MSGTASNPPFVITPAILRQVAAIGEALGRLALSPVAAGLPRLRRQNRIRTIQASLAIEGNTLNLEQVTAILDGKKVMGAPREIQEVRNAILAYDRVEQWKPSSMADLLEAQKVMMMGLVDRPGAFRTGNVGIQRGNEIVHVAPPASRVRSLVAGLLRWLERTEDHPLIAGCVFHYEFEFIHPFADGNGRMGRLWQTLILSQWKPELACLPIESVVRDRQADYYAALLRADQQGCATPFIEFMLDAIHDALKEAAAPGSSQKCSQKNSQKILALMQMEPEVTIAGLARELGCSDRTIKNQINKLRDQGKLRRVGPDKGGHWEVVE